MNATTYNTIAAVLAIGILIALAVTVISFAAMIYRWKTAQRRGHAIRLLSAMIAIPCLIGTQQAVLWKVYLPALGRQQMAVINAGRAEQLAATSLVHVGEAAPDFSIATADGGQFSTAAVKGDVVLINFFATWCGPCQLELPHIEQIWKEKQGSKNFHLLVIGREESVETVREFRDKHGFSFPIAADPDRAAYSLFAKESIPRTLVIAPDGTVVYSRAGFHVDDLNELKAVLDQLLTSNS